MTVRLPAGTYEVMVEGYSSRVGDYTLTTSCIDVPLPSSPPPGPPFSPPSVPACLLPLDLMLVLDVSGSMSDHVTSLKAFALELVDQFVLGINLTQVAVVKFNTMATTLTSLSPSR